MPRGGVSSRESSPPERGVGSGSSAVSSIASASISAGTAGPAPSRMSASARAAVPRMRGSRSRRARTSGSIASGPTLRQGPRDGAANLAHRVVEPDQQGRHRRPGRGPDPRDRRRGTLTQGRVRIVHELVQGGDRRAPMDWRAAKAEWSVPSCRPQHHDEVRDRGPRLGPDCGQCPHGRAAHSPIRILQRRHQGGGRRLRPASPVQKADGLGADLRVAILDRLHQQRDGRVTPRPPASIRRRMASRGRRIHGVPPGFERGDPGSGVRRPRIVPRGWGLARPRWGEPGQQHCRDDRRARSPEAPAHDRPPCCGVCGFSGPHGL